MKSTHTWTTEERYRPYHQWPQDHQERLAAEAAASPWRMGYHIQPISGLLNDPNGFSYFNGKWHLFYQAYPMGPVHGLKSWYHVTSDNLVDWQNEGLSLLPDSQWDSHGVYSGSAIPVKDRLFLAYTGNVRNQDWQRHAYQVGAWMDSDNHVSKIPQPLITEPPAGYTHEFRDPQVFRYQDEYLLIIGGQTTAEEGKVLTYRSQDLQNWEFSGPLAFTDEEMGFMIECPNLVFDDQQPILLFCPQGIDHSLLDYQNIYPNTYVTADSFSLSENRLVDPTPLKNLDEGFDVYATQAFNAPDGRALSVSWIGLPEIAYPTDSEGWAHCLSIVKELKLRDGQLLQRPVAEMAQLRETHKAFNFSQGETLLAPNSDHYELQLEFPADTAGTVTLFANGENNHGLSLTFDTEHGKMEFDRSQTANPFAEEYGSTRTFTIAKKALHLQIFVDTSVVEIFVNDGEQVATARYFPGEKETGITLHCDHAGSGQLWSLRQIQTS